MSISISLFGHMPKDNSPIYKYTMTNRSGASISAISYGGIVTSIKVPDKEQNLTQVTLGYDELEPYLLPNDYLGALIGRYGNRIKNSRFTLNGSEILLSQNEGEHHLHGGAVGFNSQVWNVEAKEFDGEDMLIFKLTSPDGQSGYPGNLDVIVTYRWNDANRWQIEYEAVSDKDSVLNLTHHAYFNLSGDEAEDVLGHILHINSDYITPVDKHLIPTGELFKVKDSPYDFSSPRKIGEALMQPGDWDQLVYGSGGYDINYVLNKNKTSSPVGIFSPKTNIAMQVNTDQPGVQLYTGNQLDIPSRSKKRYEKYYGFCLETQHFPDSPNRPNFPSAKIKKDIPYHTKTSYQFLIQEDDK